MQTKGWFNGERDRGDGMGKYLDQCCDDAWDVIRGRKKIANSIIEVSNETEDEELKEKVSEYGWLAPDGTFYPVEFAKHQTWSAKYIRELYRKRNTSIEELRKAGSGDRAGDWLVNRGWVLIHNPSQQNVKITRDISKVLTKAQKDFLYEWLYSHGKIEEANELYS